MPAIVASVQGSGYPDNMNSMISLDEFLSTLPKAELHLHIEGTLEPEMMYALAEHHGIELPWSTAEEIRQAYEFSDLQSFLDIYYRGNDVLRTEQDFFDLTLAYLERAHADAVRHTEIFFDPQSHTNRGIAYDLVLDGITAALREGESRFGITSGLILCFLRHLPAASAMKTLETALARREEILGVGLDSSELGFPPSGFSEVFNRARAKGLHLVAHAGEEGPSNYIREALDTLNVERIDHGVRCLEDLALVEQLRFSQIPLTVCPLSNIQLKVFARMSEHNIEKLTQAGLQVTINSDDPAYFGGYINANYASVQRAFSLDRTALAQYAVNSVKASFASAERKSALLNEIREVTSQFRLG